MALAPIEKAPPGHPAWGRLFVAACPLGTCAGLRRAMVESSGGFEEFVETFQGPDDTSLWTRGEAPAALRSQPSLRRPLTACPRGSRPTRGERNLYSPGRSPAPRGCPVRAVPTKACSAGSFFAHGERRPGRLPTVRPRTLARVRRGASRTRKSPPLDGCRAGGRFGIYRIVRAAEALRITGRWRAGQPSSWRSAYRGRSRRGATPGSNASRQP